MAEYTSTSSETWGSALTKIYNDASLYEDYDYRLYMSGNVLTLTDINISAGRLLLSRAFINSGNKGNIQTVWFQSSPIYKSVVDGTYTDLTSQSIGSVVTFKLYAKKII